MFENHLGGKHWPVSCEREFSSLQREVFVLLQPGIAVYLICKREKIPFAKESRSHDTGHCAFMYMYKTGKKILALGMCHNVCKTV
jgi:hypothetical protein